MPYDINVVIDWIKKNVNEINVNDEIHLGKTKVLLFLFYFYFILFYFILFYFIFFVSSKKILGFLSNFPPHTHRSSFAVLNPFLS